MIFTENAKVYKSPVTRRRYLTKRAAIRATARALIMKRFPTEKAEHDNLGCTYKGFHWTEMARAHVLYRRVIRIIEKQATQ